MSDHVIRHVGYAPPIPYRDWIRGSRFPNGSGGFVVEDLDLIVRRFGPAFGLDADGRFKAVEMKFGVHHLDTAQLRTFRLFDRLLRAGDPFGERYEGFYLVTRSSEFPYCDEFIINGYDVDQETLARILLGETAAPDPLW